MQNTLSWQRTCKISQLLLHFQARRTTSVFNPLIMSRHLNCSACHSPQHASTKKPKGVAPKAKDVLDIRIVPGNPNNAWIECYQNTYDEDAVVGTAEIKAKEETQKDNFGDSASGAVKLDIEQQTA